VGVLSFMAHRVPVLDAVYWFRVNFRFVPMALAAMLLVMHDRSAAKRLVLVALGSVAVQSVIGVIEFIGGPAVARIFWPGTATLGSVATQPFDTFASVGEQIVAGTMGHYNILGAYATMGFCLVIGARKLLDPDGVRRWPAALAALFALTVTLTLSRQSMGALMVAGVVVGLALGPRARRVVAAVGVAGVFVAGISLAVRAGFALKLIERFAEATTVRYWQIAMSQNRGFVMATILPTALAFDFFLGAGPGSFGRSFAGAEPIGVSRLSLPPGSNEFVVDVGFAAVGIQTGILGLAAFLGIIGTLAARSLRLAQAEEPWHGLGVAGLGVAITVLLTNFASTPLIFKPTSALAWLVFGIVAGREAVRT